MPDPIANTVGTKVIENLIDRILNFILNPITVRITVVRNCKENIENLKSKVEELTNEKNRVENYKKDVERRGEVVDDRIQTWLTKAHGFFRAAEESVRVGDEFAKECFFRLCPNPVSRYKLSKKAGQNSQSIAELVQEARGFDIPLSHSASPQQDVVAVGEGFQKFSSRMAVLDQIMEALRNPMVNMIGVHGTSGVGKTVLVKMVKGKAKQDSLFTNVVMATVTKGRDLKSIQEDIARDLGMDQLSFKDLTVRQVADRIKGRLIKVKKFLVILDDIWEPEIDLEKFGIPSASELKQHVKKKNEESSFGQDMLCKTEIDFEESGIPCASELKHHAKKKNEESSSGQDMHYKTEIDFEKSGIPSTSGLKQHIKKKNEESSSGQEDMLCRILLISRYREVLSGVLGEKDHVFEVHKLEDDEAWHLFKTIVGKIVESPDFEPTAKEIVKKCLGLPVAIASVGKAMKGKTQQDEWRTALIELRKPTPQGISAAVYKPIELSYKYLQEDELKQTFMLCSLLGHDSSINDLLKYGMGLNLFQKVKTMEETRAKVLSLVRRLKFSSLLVDGHSNMHFGMHDQIRKIALSIASRDHGVLALVDEDVGKEWPEKETMEKLNWIYLSNDHLELMSNRLKCPRLTFFHLSNKGCSLRVPLDLFTEAKGLKILCLTRIDFQSTPSQIPLIPTKLHTLLLDQCVFRVEEFATVIVTLENLEVLSLAGCDIEKLPREMEKLTKLKLLDVSDCTKLRVIPRQVLERLSKLEELKMGNSFDQWDDAEEGNARLAELTELHKLSALEVRIPNFRGTFFPENLVSFKIFIGVVTWKSWPFWDSYSWGSSFESSKIMKLKLQGASIKSNDSVKKLLKETEELYLEGLNGVESLVDELDDEGFQHLKWLQVQNAPDIRSIFNPAGRLVPSHVFPILEVLTLCNLEKMEKICHGLIGAALFKVLRKVTVVGCHQLKNLFSSSMARQLQLQEIIVEDCDNIEQIIDDVEEQGNGNDIVEESEGGRLGNLRSLRLRKLPKLISFNSNSSDISLFNNKVGYSGLENLMLSELPQLIEIWNENLQQILPFKKLKYLKVCNCSLRYLLTTSMAVGLQQLQNLIVTNCATMEQVIVGEGDEEMFPMLNYIFIKSCSNLTCFYKGSNKLKFASLKAITLIECPVMVSFSSSFSTKEQKVTSIDDDKGSEERSNIHTQPFFSEEVEFPNLEFMRLSSLNIQQIWHNSLPEISSFFRNLKALFVDGCANLKYLLISSIVKSFEELIELRIWNCKMIEGVIVTEGLVEEERMPERFFPKLDSLMLCELPQLTRFWSGNFFEFSSLRQLKITSCPRLKTFISSSIIGDMTTRFERAEDTCTSPLFDAKVAFPKLELLVIGFMESLNKIWEDQLRTDSFCQLTFVSVASCAKLLNIFPFTMLERLKKLDKLEIWDCGSLEEIFKFQDLVAGQSQAHITAQPTMMEFATKLVLPKLAHLDLKRLPKLRGFIPQMYSVMYFTEWPSLKKLWVYGCDQVQTFALELPSFKRTNGGDQIKIQLECPLFWASQDSFPCLEELKLGWNNRMKEIWRGQYPGDYFPKLKDIELNRFQKHSALLPSFFFQSLPSLERFVVSEASFHEIFHCERLRSEERPINAPSRLSKLSLSKLHELMHLWKEEFDFKSIFYNLRTLEVLECNKLINLVPSTINFENMQILEVSKCDRLVNLVRYSTAKSLVQLTRMKVSDCNTISEIVACTDDEVKDAIIFRQLKYLQLFGLPRLASFCSVECNFVLPSLEEVILEKCPRMKIFSVGEVRTSQLERVQFTEDKDSWRWEGNLNTTIQKLFTKKVGYFELENLKLYEFPELIEIWNKNHEEILSFKKLQYLEVYNCSSLSYLLTPSMAFGLVQLKDLKIKDCATMEQVIMVIGVEEVIESGLILFPQLKSISLKSCPKLSSFYVGSNTLKFPILEKITVKDCLKMVRFTSKFLSEQRKETINGRSEKMIVKEELDIFIEAFFGDEVEILILKMLTLSSINIKQIWNNQLSSISSFVQHLTELTVVNCSNLKYLFTFSMVKSFVQLEELEISGCEMMEVVILIEGTVEEEKICQTVFPKLDALALNDLPQLATFCSNSDSLGEIFDYERDNIGTRSQKLLATQSTLVETKATKLVFTQMTILVLRLLPKFKSFFPQMHITEWPSLERLVVIECHGAQIIASKFSGIEMTHGDNQLERESQHLMFWISKATFPRLKWLVVKWNDNMKIECGHHPEEYFGELEYLQLLGFPKQSVFLSPFFFYSLPNLKNLIVKDAFFDEIFKCEKVTSEEKPVCGRTPLSKLRLSKLHELTHLWKEESQLKVDILNNLTILKVQECIRLKNLVPSTVHFDNLQTLVISECHGLVNLVRYSTAKSLVQLKRMKVANCEMIEEIVVCLGDVVKDGIVFTKLECLQLKGLQRLESFCSGICNFKFPALEEVIVTECANMQTFSKEELSTPKLQEVKLIGDIDEDKDEEIDVDIEKSLDDYFYKDEDEGVADDEVEVERCWVDNLNSTIQQLFKEKSDHNSKKGNGENSDHDSKEDEYLIKILKKALVVILRKITLMVLKMGQVDSEVLMVRSKYKLDFCATRSFIAFAFKKNLSVSKICVRHDMILSSS